MEYVFVVIIVNLIQHKMVEDKHGIDEVEVAGKRALHSVIDDFVISEEIVVQKRSNAGHPTEITKIYSRLDESLHEIETKTITLSGSNMHMFTTIFFILRFYSVTT